MIINILLSIFLTFQPANSVSFTLRNATLSSIPLEIPGVMNPNLSPMSNSGVTLEVGQKVYYFPSGQKAKGKRALLLIADESLEGKTLIVNELIDELEKKAQD